MNLFRSKMRFNFFTLAPTSNILILTLGMKNLCGLTNIQKFQKNMHFFAQDIFEIQIMVFESEIYKFDPETENIEFIANYFENWAKIILDDYNYMTGH